MATCALLLYYGRLALLEPMIVLFLVLGLVLLVSDRTDRAALRSLAAGTAFALAIGTKPTSALAVLGILLGATLATRGSVPNLARRALAAAAAIAAMGIAWAIIVIPQPGLFDTILRIWPPQTLPDSLGEALMRARDYLRGSDRAIGMTAPLVGGSLVGIVLLAAQWSRLGRERRALAGAAVGWLVIGLAVLLVVSYRPNRYVVQLVPPMAILTAFGFTLALAIIQRRLAFMRRPGIVAAAIVAVSIGLAVRGMGNLAEWTARATYRLPEIQAEVLATVTDGHAIQGAGPTMAMRVPVPTIIVQEDVNAGDLYRTHGVRWLLTNRQMTPTWAEIHPEVWAARELLVCYPWPSGEACLIHVP
jgi:4-amino-4-deoxy-L-arabinose transferase-like glycosyltransferase